MRVIGKFIKIILAIVLTVYSLIIIYLLFLSPKEQRFELAGNMQGAGLSQSMFEILNQQHPEYSDPFFERSVAFNKRSDYYTGFVYLSQAVNLEPKKHLGYRGYMKLRFLRDYQGALADFNRLDLLTPKVVDAPWGEDIDFLRGESHYGRGDYLMALESFNRSISNQGAEWADIHSFVYQGLCHYGMSDFESAKSSFENALAQYENTPEAHFGLGKTFLELGDTANAIKSLNHAKRNIAFKRDDPYKEFINEIYLEEIQKLINTLSE